MNRARVAAALRELASALEDDDAPGPPRPARKPPRKRAREARTMPAPPDVSDLDIARAREAARRAGILIDG